MKRVGITLLVIVLAAGAWLVVQGQHPSSQVYTPAQVKAGLLRHPQDWAGRTVLVRGLLIDLGRPFHLHDVVLAPAPPGDSSTEAFMSIYTFTLSRSDMLQLKTQSPTPLESWLHRVPLIGPSLFPVVRADTPRVSVYRLHLLPPSSACRVFVKVRLCADASLTDYQSQ